MQQKVKNLFKITVLTLSVYFAWATLLYNPSIDDGGFLFSSIPFTILTIYAWNSLNKSN